jgi:tetratricopeptide (TPR) repeat protein
MRICGPKRFACDLFALQNEITSRIAVALNLELIGAEAARPTEHPDAPDYILRGRAASNKPQTRDTRAEVIGLFERALELDPRSVEAQGALATTLAATAMDGMTDSAAADIARAEGLAGQALAATPCSPLAHHAKAQVLRAQAQVLGAQGRCEEAIPEYETAIALNRNSVFSIAALGWCKLLTGSIVSRMNREIHTTLGAPGGQSPRGKHHRDRPQMGLRPYGPVLGGIPQTVW